MKKLIILIAPILIACQKDDHTSDKYRIDTKVQVSINDNAGTDLLEEIDLDAIELKSYGEKSDKSLPYEIDITVEPISPEFYFYRPEKQNKGLSSIELHLLYTHEKPTTVINWNNGLKPDTLRGDIVYDKNKNLVTLSTLFLNGKQVWTNKDGNDRSIVIEKKLIN